MEPGTSHDALVVRSFAEGEAGARAELLAALLPYLRELLARYLRPAVPGANPEDLIPEVAAQVWGRNLNTPPRTLGEFRSYLSRVAWQCVQDFLRKQRVRRVQEAGKAEFPYEQLLAFSRGQLNRAASDEIQRRVETDPRWRAHYESVRFLDLERLAARQDAKELEGFVAPKDAPFCRSVAQSAGAVLRDLLREGAQRPASQGSEGLREHALRCVYCRRMLRLQQADLARDANGLPPGEKLLREWLLEDAYREALDRVTGQLLGRGKRRIPLFRPRSNRAAAWGPDVPLHFLNAEEGCEVWIYQAGVEGQSTVQVVRAPGKPLGLAVGGRQLDLKQPFDPHGFAAVLTQEIRPLAEQDAHPDLLIE